MSPGLREFYRFYMLDRPRPTVPENGIRMLSNSTEVVLHRDPPYQVELITIRAGAEVHEHAHPNVDTYEVVLSGSKNLIATVGDRVHGILAKRSGIIVPIPRGVVHSASPGGEILCLLSFQEWHNGVTPTFITDDWIGRPWL